MRILKISLFLILLLIIGATIFIVTPDFVSAKPFGLPTVDFAEIATEIARVHERIPGIINTLFYITTALLGLLLIILNFLNWAIGIGMYLGDGSLGHVFYDTGYHWVLGTVTMFFIIAFVFAALLYILDVEWGIVDKKTILKLIIVALLINFSSLFVKIIVDFFIILERGVAEQLLPGGLGASLTVIGLQASLNWVVMVFIPYLSKKLVMTKAAILGKLTFGVASLIARIGKIAVLPLLTVPFIMEIISNLLLSIVFFTYAILFIARSVVIYALLMLAPLAMVCIIFPKTRKYFDGWLKQLFLWGIMGTVISFVLSFGFQMRGLVADRFNVGLIEGFGIDIGIGVGGIMIFVANLFFAIYAIIMLFMIKRFLPSAAQGFVSIVQKGATLAAVAGGGMIAGAALMKHGSGVQKVLSGMAEKVGGPDTFFGRELAKGARNIGDRIEKTREERSKYYDDYTEEQKTEALKKPGISVESKRVILKSMQRGGQKLTDKNIKDAGFEKNGKADFKKFAEFIGSDFEKEDYYERCRYSKKIQDGIDEIEKLKGEGAAEIKIKNQEEKNQSAIRKIGLNASSKDLEKIVEGNPDLLKNKVFVDAVNERKDPQAMYAICQNNEGKLKELVKKKIEDYKGDIDQLMKCVEDYQPLFEKAAILPNITLSSALVRRVVGGDASESEKEKLYIQLEKMRGMEEEAEKRVDERAKIREGIEEKQKKEKMKKEEKMKREVEAEIKKEEEK